MNSKNPRWRTAAILKTGKSPHLCNRSTNFDEIWHGEAYFMLVYDRMAIAVLSARNQSHFSLVRLAALRQLVLSPNNRDSQLAPEQASEYKC